MTAKASTTPRKGAHTGVGEESFVQEVGLELVLQGGLDLTKQTEKEGLQGTQMPPLTQRRDCKPEQLRRGKQLY